MVYKTQTKRKRDIKSKLMAAVCMLLVSSIMMVSTTYAWFTLSTAPEVTGINTAVGANGNLEMALLPTDAGDHLVTDNYGITSSAGDSTAALNLRNVTWGNLVDLSYAVNNANYYGLDKITLYPAALNLNDNGTLADLMLETPTYGADGRVDKLTPNTVASVYDSAKGIFPQTEGYGVRAVGTASGMTDRQLAYRNARSAANTAMSMAKTVSSQSLNTNGAALANIAITHAANDGAEEYTNADIANLLAIVYDLLGKDNDDGSHTTGVLEHIESAYLNYIVAYGASQTAVTAGLTDENYKTFESAITGAADVYAAANLCSTYGIILPESVTGPLAKLKATRTTVTEAKTGLESITAESGIKWDDFSTYLYKLANVDKMKINGYEASSFRNNMSNIINKVASGGLVVTIATGGGVYADVADHCGDFTASITINKVEYGGMVLENMNARMETETTVSPVYLSVLGTAVEAAGAPTSGEGSQIMPISDFYGYIIDLAFRTNAAESNLLLQTAAADRIYSDNGTDAETMGHGSTMTFTSTTADFTADQLSNLMSAIRVVFFDPMESNKVLGTAKLDMANKTVTGGNTITASLYLYEQTAATTSYVEATADQKADTTTTLYTKDADAETYTAVTAGTTLDENTTYYVKVETAAGETKLEGSEAVIKALTQNTATTVSALVYLDGENVGNDDVAATAATSMTGTMNLQFASSANLVPMEYTPLIVAGTTTETTESTTATEATTGA